MSRKSLAWRVLALGLVANMLLAPLAAAQIIIVPGIKGKLVEVVVTEGEIRMPAMVKRGWTTFRLTNAGREYHSLAVAGHKETRSLPIAIPPGTAALLPIKLHEGVYTVWCPMQGHADSGERVTLVVYK